MPINSGKRNYCYKRRVRAHVIADLSVNYIEKLVFKKRFIVECSVHDYGYDMAIETFNKFGEYENGQIKIQAKAQERIEILRSKQIALRCDVRDLKLWYTETDPVILILYDAKNEKAFWIYIQYYLRKQNIFPDQIKRKSLNIHIPLENILNEKAILRFRKFKIANQNQSSKVITYKYE